MTPFPESEIPLRHYIDTQIHSTEKLFDARVSATERAIVVAAGLMDKRVDGLNEVRTQLKEQFATLMPRAEICPTISRITDDIRSLQLSKATLEGKASQMSVNIALFISILSLILGSIHVVLRIFVK